MKTTQKFLSWLLLTGALCFSQVGLAQWTVDGSLLYTLDEFIGIGTTGPYEKLHLLDSGATFIRIESEGENLADCSAGLRLANVAEADISVWNVFNTDNRLNFTTGLDQAFELGSDYGIFGTNPNRVKVDVYSKYISPNGSSWANGGLELVAGNQRLTFDPNQIESASKFYLNYYSNQDMLLGIGGGNVGIGTANSEARLNISGEGYQVKLNNSGNQGLAWRIGSSNNSWASGSGKLVFTHTSASSDATMVMTSAGRVGIGLTTPSRTLHVDGTTRTTVLEITGGADIAEPFNVADANEWKTLPGTVVSIDPNSPGDLRISRKAHDKAVAGIISGAGDIQPGMVMGQDGSIAAGEHPVALSGRVYCKVDATYGAIQPGDILTTSDTPGHAMKVQNQGEAQGAIIGKAMTTLMEGKGLVLVLVSLQ